MVSLARNIAVPLRRPWREEASDRFIARAKALGIEASPLEITRPARVFPWIRANEEFLRVSWRQKKSLSILGLFRVSWTKEGSGIFRQHPAFKVLMPLEGERAAHLLRGLPEVEEMAVLEERRIDPILAVKVGGNWYEVFRWWESPHILPDDCPLIASEKAATESAIAL